MVLACHLKSIQVEKRTRHLMIPKLNALLTVRQAAMYRRLLSDNTRRRITDVSLRYRSAPPPLPLVCCRGAASSKPPPSGRLPSTGNGLIGMPPPPRSPPSTVKSKPKISPPAAAARAPSIIEVDVKNFVALLNSPVPVILDCYATWCDPCKKLTPVLEKIVGKYPGRVILGKLDVDKHPELAAQLKVSSLPAVFGLCEGKLVDRFVGMPTEPILAGFLDKMLSIIPPAGTDEGVDGAPSVAERQEADLAMADSLMKGGNNGGKEEKDKATKAGALYKQVYEELAAEETPAPYLQARCLAGLARCALMGGAAEEARQIVQLLRTKHKAEMESILEVASAVSFAEVVMQAPPEEGGLSVEDTLKKLQGDVLKAPTDLEARYQLALKCFQLQRFEAAMNECLEIIKREKEWKEGAAKALLLKIFEALGPQNEVTKKGRQRMTNYLFL